MPPAQKELAAVDFAVLAREHAQTGGEAEVELALVAVAWLELLLRGWLVSVAVSFWFGAVFFEEVLVVVVRPQPPIEE